LIEQEADKELLVYDLQINRAYNLNETLKNIFTACDGKTSFEELRLRYKYTDDLIYFALKELNQNNLLENYQSVRFAGLPRREVIRRVGLATMAALPVIASLAAPKAIHAASGAAAIDMCEEVQCPYAQNVCKEDGICDPATGDCLEPNRPAGTPCDDGDFSTTGETCDGSGNCVGICGAGLTNCGAAPRCRNLQNDSNNCGFCNNVCSGGQTCISGTCISPT
jgi:hypothetical protein